MEVKCKYWNENDTFKIMFKYDAGDCNLRAQNVARYTKAEGKHKELFKTKGLELLIRDEGDFMNLLCHTNLNSTFTYCFKSDGRLYLCKTSGEKDENKCKHMWLCNKLVSMGSTGVCSAGVMKVIRPNKVYIDNLSGTYKPTIKDLESLQACLLQYFPDLNVGLLNPFQSPREKRRYCKIMDTNNMDYSNICSEFTNLSELSDKSPPVTPTESPQKSLRKSSRSSSKRRSKRKSQKSQDFSSVDLDEI
jgi:hypothetical protein